jgi:hypothetical protein
LSNVPVRLLVVEAVPPFWTQKLTVTVSFGSIVLLGGAQLSAVMVLVLATITGVGTEVHWVNLKFPIRVLQEVLVVA